MLFPTHWTTVDAPAVVDWKNTHPLLRYINLDNVQISSAFAVKPPTWGVPLVEAPQTPLILAGEINHQRIVWIGFDTLQSTWPLRISFPNIRRQRRPLARPGKRPRLGQLMLHGGEPFRFALAQPASGGASHASRRASRNPAACATSAKCFLATPANKAFITCTSGPTT